MVAIASAVVGAVVGAVITNLVAQVFKLAEKRLGLSDDFRRNIESIKRDLQMIAAAEEGWLAGKGDPSALMSVSMEEMRDLAQDIEDCLDRIVRYYSEFEAEASLRRGLRAVRCAVSPRFADEVEQLKERLAAAHQRTVNYNVNGSQPPAVATPEVSSMSQENAGLSNKIEPVGIEEPKKEIMNLLNEDQLEQLNVISIVGFGGSGKSTLVEAVYDCPDIAIKFPCRAWIPASEHTGKGLLMALHKKFCQRARGDGNAQQLQTEISDYLKYRR